MASASPRRSVAFDGTSDDVVCVVCVSDRGFSFSLLLRRLLPRNDIYLALSVKERGKVEIVDLETNYTRSP